MTDQPQYVNLDFGNNAQIKKLSPGTAPTDGINYNQLNTALSGAILKTPNSLNANTIGLVASYHGVVIIPYVTQSVDILQVQDVTGELAVRIDNNSHLLTKPALVASGVTTLGQVTVLANTLISGHAALADPHAGYLVVDPSDSSRNWIVRSSDITPLILGGGSEFYNEDILQIEDGFGAKAVWVTSDGILKSNGALVDNSSVVTKGGLGTSAFLNYGTASGTIITGADDRLIPRRLHSRLGIDQNWTNAGNAQWAFVASGITAPTRYFAKARFFTENQIPSIGKVNTIDCNTGLVGDETACQYESSNPHNFVSGCIIIAEHKIANNTSMRLARIGMWGNDDVLSANGPPPIGFWLEYDRGVSTTKWRLHGAGSGGQTNVDCASLILSDSWIRGAFVVGSDQTVKYYRCSISGYYLEATISGTKIPLTSTEQQGTLFWQAGKVSGTAVRPHHQVGRLGKFLSFDDYPRYPLL